ncbi:MAG: Nif3-like dinuclear metal center hexameric protein [Sphaerochaetaceae bacterium]|nr:Nif3-like dinuclear metal center hexameric protein [Sphaerochaetaceae bacterium]
MTVFELKNYFDQLFDTPSFHSFDASLNGLQVGNEDKEISCVAFAEDACIQTIKEAAEKKADFLFVHHGLFWGSAKPVTGALYERIKLLMENHIALYACHLPLDCHEELSHNAQMARLLKIKKSYPFAWVGPRATGLYGELEKPLKAEEICRMLGREKPVSVMGNKDKELKKVGIISGDGNSDLLQAISLGLDALVTGETHYSSYNDCVDNGFTIINMGHYFTEVFGVKQTMKKIEEEKGLKTVFIDVPCAL